MRKKIKQPKKSTNQISQLNNVKEKPPDKKMFSLQESNS